MSIADGIISLVIWLYQNTVLKLLPTDLTAYSVNDFKTHLELLYNTIINPFYLFNKIAPLDWLFILMTTLMLTELTLVGIRAIVFGYNLMRGSGAKV